MPRLHLLAPILFGYAIAAACTCAAGEPARVSLRVAAAQIPVSEDNGGRNGSEWSRNVFWPFHESNLKIRRKRESCGS